MTQHHSGANSLFLSLTRKNCFDLSFCTFNTNVNIRQALEAYEVVHAIFSGFFFLISKRNEVFIFCKFCLWQGI